MVAFLVNCLKAKDVEEKIWPTAHFLCSMNLSLFKLAQKTS